MNATVDLARAARRPEFIGDGHPACVDQDPEIFYLDERLSRTALDVCWGCELQEPCFRWAVLTGQEFGVWGGYTADQRRVIRRRLGIR